MAFEYLAEYATFQSVGDMDEAVKQHIDKLRLDLTTSERAIVFALAGRSLLHVGASHLKAETIANAVSVSTKTVYRSIKKLTDLNIIEKVLQPKLNGIKGASIYRILPFDNNVPSNVSQRAVVDEASNDEGCPPQFEELSIKSFNLLSSKQANNIMSLENELALQAEKKKEWMNEYQIMLFNFLHSLPLADKLKDELHKVVLAAQVNSVEGFVKAKNVIFKIAKDIADGTLTVTSTLRAVFTGAYNKALERLNSKAGNSSIIEKTPIRERPVEFYDWLNERENNEPIYINTRPSIDNWLGW
ncbi:helix-turn-helix domain-containing protein [Solibacillus cecembensis]|uniref:helix-turn-helix domain-containing protein n=1 Tax=Solibacillus cecembensis TaxID=459347 RepID=UPI003D051B75